MQLVLQFHWIVKTAHREKNETQLEGFLRCEASPFFPFGSRPKEKMKTYILSWSSKKKKTRKKISFCMETWATFRREEQNTHTNTLLSTGWDTSRDAGHLGSNWGRGSKPLFEGDSFFLFFWLRARMETEAHQPVLKRVYDALLSPMIPFLSRRTFSNLPFGLLLVHTVAGRSTRPSPFDLTFFRSISGKFYCSISAKLSTLKMGRGDF